MNILFLIFNRPHETERVFETIRRVKPAKLFIAADGPRSNKIEDIELCKKARECISNIDWSCELITRYQDDNLGCKLHVSSAISWFFENVEEGIILEDDCLPDLSFYSFCSELLEHYRDNKKIMHISGTCFMQPKEKKGGSYTFSHIPHIWGWATWRRAWKEYNLEMELLEKNKFFTYLFKDSRVGFFWYSLFSHIKKENVDTWDASWAFAIMRKKGICITPFTNMVENIGFIAGTHSVQPNTYINGQSHALDHIVHPDILDVDLKRDCEETYFLYIEPWHKKLYRRISKLLKMS